MNPEQLKSIAVLEGMGMDALTGLAAVLEEKAYEEGDIIFVEGDPGDSMYFIMSGCVRVEKRAHTAGAAAKTLAVLEAGDYFGEMALLDQKPRSAAAVSAGSVRALRLSKAAFEDLQRNNALAGTKVLFGMIRTSSERIRRLSAQLVVYDEVGKAIGEAHDLQTLLDVILQQLASATGADWGFIVLRSQFAETLELRSRVNLALTSEQTAVLVAGKGFLEPILTNPGDRLINDLAEDEQFKKIPQLGFETPSMLVSPILVEGRVLGLVVLGSKARSGFDLDALNLARGVSRQTAQAILNARHREEEQSRSRHARQYVRF